MPISSDRHPRLAFNILTFPNAEDYRGGVGAIALESGFESAKRFRQEAFTDITIGDGSVGRRV
jgi:hypothetical protein